MSEPFRHRMRVRYAECDPQSIVFNSRYLEYFDVGLTELWREAIGPYAEVIEQLGVDQVVAEANVRYLGSLRFDEEFDLLVGVERLGTTSMIIGLAIDRDGDRVAEGTIRYVCVDREGESTPVPERLRGALSGYPSPLGDPG